MKYYEDFYDDRGFMQPYAENGSLFAITGMILASKTDDPERLNYQTQQSLRAIDNVYDGKDIIYFDGKGTWSHDNQTGLVSASRLLNLDIHKKYFLHSWERRWHPRDIGYYLACIFPWLSFLFLIPTKIAMIISCYESYKYKPGFFSRLKRGYIFGKVIEKSSDENDPDYYTKYRSVITGKEWYVRRLVKTDGKILAYIRFNTFNMPLTKKICTRLLERNAYFGGWKKVFQIYFGENHPNSNLTEEQYRL